MDHQRIIYILEFFQNYTNESRRATLHDIRNYLAGYEDINTPAILTIRRDIDRLQSAGHHIMVSYGPHHTAYYYLVKKGFTFNEIRFIVDSVSINKFLTDEQRKNLIRKFEGLCSTDEVRQLISRVAVKNQPANSADLLENLDKVHRIISMNREINFQYGKFNTRKQKCYYDKPRTMLPCKVVYFNERFYLKCIDEDTGKLRTYRIDRMKSIKAGKPAQERPVLPQPEGIVMDMFEPETYVYVKLRIRAFLLDDMLEQFGTGITILKDDAAHSDCVIIREKIGISRGFYKWVMKYGADIEILAPASVRETFIQKLRDMTALYETETENE